MDGWLAALPEPRRLNLNSCTAIQHVTLAAATKLEALDVSICGALQQLLVPGPTLRRRLLRPAGGPCRLGLRA